MLGSSNHRKTDVFGVVERESAINGVFAHVTWNAE
jgi:hypothetical protein